MRLGYLGNISNHLKQFKVCIYKNLIISSPTGASNNPPVNPVNESARKTCQTSLENLMVSQAAKNGMLTNCMAFFLPKGWVIGPERRHPTGTEIKLIEPKFNDFFFRRNYLMIKILKYLSMIMHPGLI